MTASIYQYQFQLIDLATGRSLNHGGQFKVVAKDGTAAVTLVTEDNAAASNPATINAGTGTFYTATSVPSVDIYGFTDKGYSFVVKDLKPGETGSVLINTFALRQLLMIPFNFADSGVSGTAENDSGFRLPHQAMLDPIGVGVKVVTNQSGKGIDVGVDSTSGNDDADGLLDGISLATAGMVFGQVGYTVGTNSILVDVTGGTAEWTLGALFHPANTKDAAKAEGTDSATTKNGIYFLRPHASNAASAAVTEKITYTGTSTPTTAAGFILIPMTITVPSN